MRTRQGNQLTMACAARAFLNENAQHLPRTYASEARRQLETLTDGMFGHAIDEQAGRTGQRSETQNYHALRKDLMQRHIAPIVAIAQSALAKEVELSAFRMPRGNPTCALLEGFAHGLAKSAEGHEAFFIASGLDADFVAQLRNAADAMQSAYVGRELKKGRALSASVGIKNNLRDARSILRVLTLLVRNESAGNVALLGGWYNVASPRDYTRLAAAAQKEAQRALPAPSMKLLSGGSDESAREPAGLFAPLTRLFRAS